jgi:hypothetical protein
MMSRGLKSNDQTTLDLLATVSPGKSILLYPSSGDYFGELDQTQNESVILVSDHFRVSERIGSTFCFKSDNNFVLGVMLGKKLKAKCLCVIRDGCCEGGNYECILCTNSVGRLLSILDKDFVLFRDHGFRRNKYPCKRQKRGQLEVLEQIKAHSRPLGVCRTFDVQQLPTTNAIAQVGRIQLEVCHDTIWNHFHESSRIYIAAQTSDEGLSHFCRGLRAADCDPGKVHVLTHRPVLSITELLEHASSEKLENLCFGPIADGNYEQIISEIQNHRGDYPRLIRWCHLIKEDGFAIRKRLIPFQGIS